MPPLNASALSQTTVAHCRLGLGARDLPYLSYFDLGAQRLRLAWRAEQFQLTPRGDSVPTVRWQVVDIPDTEPDRFAGWPYLRDS